MSKLPNAPLLEVIFELKWTISNKSDLEKIQYLHGDLYAELKNEYPEREGLVPPQVPLDILINKPVHRFRKTKNGYPLTQIGPGLITLNTIDSSYYWEDFFNWARFLLDKFFKVFGQIKNQTIYPNLVYIDFFPLDFQNVDAYAFVNDNFNLTFNQNFYRPTIPKPNNINLGFYYTTKYGNLSVTFQKAKDSSQTDGIMVQTRIDGRDSKPETGNILNWLDTTHEICSDLFKQLTKGKLYESFK